MTCDTCKFWTGEPHDGELAPVGWRECECPKVDSENKDGQMLDYVGRTCIGKVDDAEYAFANDHTPATIVTGPKFGCIHHQPKQ